MISGNNNMDEVRRVDRYIYTTINLLNHLMFGLTFSSFGPTYVDFKYLTSSDMSWVVGFLYKYLNRQLTLAILITIQSLATIFMPYSTQIWHLYLCIFLYGLGIGAWNNSNNVILIEMWQQASPSFLQFSQFIYGVGTILGPLIVGPYLSGEVKYVDRVAIGNGSYEHLVWNNTIIDEFESNRRSRITFPYLVGGLLQAIGPGLMFLMYFCRPYKYQAEADPCAGTGTDTERAPLLTASCIRKLALAIPKKTIILCVSLYLAFGIMSENMYMDFSTTYFQFSPLHLTANRAAEIFATMSIALSTGRGLSVFIAMKLRPQTMIAYQTCIVFMGYLYQYFGQYWSVGHLWASSLMICFGYSSIFICLFSFVGQYMEVTDRVGAVFIASYNSVYLFLPFFLGSYIEEWPNSFLYIEFGSLCAAIGALVVVLLAVRKVPNECLRL
ncbi:unnamed protein product [Medioppia subpectinata]|uniref:Uncharacterized protein n=1 Tax=Medioppia subpectinata TaxID=1979941 RepID=A0A7R9PVS8_9ACAR|nr:unnamed protein product [Medioppia subpectinata]CAG2103160.1 unnamed protein product [Medioppia subpectinata]